MVYVPLPVNLLSVNATFDPIPQSFAALITVVFVVAPLTQYSKLKVYSSSFSTSAEQYALISAVLPLYPLKSKSHTGFMLFSGSSGLSGTSGSSPVDGSNVSVSTSEIVTNSALNNSPLKMLEGVLAIMLSLVPSFTSVTSHI